MKKITAIFPLFLPFIMLAQNSYPPQVKAALAHTKTNKVQLTKALDHFYADGDSLKIKSINFLVANMPIHYSANYYWANSLGRKLVYNELDYPTFDSAVMAFERLKTVHGKLHPVPYTYRDMDSIKADMLIENVELATENYRKLGNTTAGDDFFEYVLPYRASVEPLQDWRRLYAQKFGTLFDAAEPEDAQLLHLRQMENSLFSNKFGLENKSEPLPRLGALQILLRQKGFCEDIADMATFMARSRGVAATVDIVTAWATSTGSHFLNYIRTSDKLAGVHFDAVLDSLGREPAKVLRTTFSPQKDALATWLDTANIPQGYLRMKNYRDVTNEYWQVDSVTTAVFPFNIKAGNVPQPKVVYMAVLNGGYWQPTWYGKINSGKAVCTKMTKGVVYLPMYYINKMLVPAGWPYALGYHNRQVLQPDFQHRHSIVLPEQEKYLKYRPGKKYRLFVWNNQWQPIAEQTAPNGCTKLSFENVPKNALLIMWPEYSQGKERPFMILDNGDRVWW